MSKVKNKKQPSSKGLLFPIAFFKEVGRTIKYMVTSLSQSMRRKVSFDYMVMYIIVSFITLFVFTTAFNLSQIRIVNDDRLEEVYNLAVLNEKGSLSDNAMKNQFNNIGEKDDIGIEVLVTHYSGELEDYVVNNGLYPSELYEMRYVENIWLFFSRGLVKKADSFQYALDEETIVDIDVQLVHKFNFESPLRNVLVIAIMISQIIGITIMSIVGSYRLKRVFMPIFMLTRTAESISISNMDARLDVSKAQYELKDLANTFNEMINRIQEDYVKQKRFVSDVSHELRTPISIVNGYARMLDRWGKTDEAILEESIDAIKGESKNMQVLVENLLTLVRSDNQTLKFEKDSFDISELGHDLMKDMEMIDEQRHTFSSQIQEEIQVCLDYAKVKQTLRIFLDNAIKYTPEGGHISIEMEEKGKAVEVRISDTGIGIGKEDLPYLFDRFYRSDESRTRETGGHGLGLAIAKAMIIGQEGRIRVKSKPHEGSTFILTLPFNCEE